MARLAIVLFAVALIVYAFIDCARADSSRMPAKISKPVWLILIVILPVLGALIWIFFKYQHFFFSGAQTTFGPPQNPFTRGKKPTGPVAPDDDPEFLARLEARNRRRAYEERMRAEGRLPEEDDKKKDEDDADEGGLYGHR